MDDIKAVIRAPIDDVADSDLRPHFDGPAPEAVYFFPSFPAPPPRVNIKSFEQWVPQGVYLSQVDKNSSWSRDGKGLQFPANSSQGLGIQGVQNLEERMREKKLRQLQKGKLGVRVVKEDCFKIGDEGVEWEEPEGTSKSSYDISIPPFTRLINATRDFLNSRNEEFQFNRTKRLMESVRISFGLRAEFSGEHCRGSGEEGTAYTAPSSLETRKRRKKPKAQRTLADVPDETEEVCPLLRDPLMAVRGFLALVRRDAEAGWDIDPALKLARVASSFICFVHHYQVIPELSEGFAAAAHLARSAVRCLLDAKSFEDLLGKGTNFNRALWAVYGGQWKGPERGGMELEPPTQVVEEVEESGSDGGWEVERMPDLRPSAPSLQDARSTLETPLAPLDVSKIKMRGYVPYSRRKVVSVSTPSAESGGPTFMSTLHRVVTVAAPWTMEERWRARALMEDSEDEESDDEASDSRGFELEKETPSIAEPETIELWFEADQLTCDTQSLVGMGLRGRWAVMGLDEGPQWWTFKAKDFILPAFWQS